MKHAVDNNDVMIVVITNRVACEDMVVVVVVVVVDAVLPKFLQLFFIPESNNLFFYVETYIIKNTFKRDKKLGCIVKKQTLYQPKIPCYVGNFTKLKFDWLGASITSTTTGSDQESFR